MASKLRWEPTNPKSLIRSTQSHSSVFTLVTQPQPLSLSFSVQPPPCYRRRRNFKATIKEFPKKLLLELHPSDFDVLFIHLMFGPEFAPNGWTGLLFIFEKVRILDKEHRVSRGEKFLNRFAREGCRMMEMICEDHDHYAAGLQFITHTVGRSFKGLMLESMPINMKRYESLLELGENTVGDSFDLYYGLFMFNKNFLEVLEKLDLAFGNLRKQLIAWMHHVVRNQLMENQLDGSNNHTLLWRAHNGSTLLHSRSNDVALLSDFASNNSSPSDENTKLKIAISVKLLRSWRILDQTTPMWLGVGVSYFNDADDIFEQHPKVILLCTSILSTVKVLKSLPFQRLKRSTLFADVLDVKEFPKNLFLQHLPPDFDVLCTHPVFGPESGKHGWKELPLIYDKVRIRNEESRILRYYGFLDIFASEGLQMVEISSAKHDWHVAGSQFVTHTTGRFLEKLELETTPINTKRYETLLSLVENIVGDRWTDLPFVFEKVRIIDEEHCVSRCAKFLNTFAKEGCRMEEMSCKDHNCYAASS
ncbi:hypothetical protein Ahy_A06g029127 [Arachis hypogaea]|uniref:Prephenate/arogenate dehydrogenase domain-containing protein n=1 Tax=Arachis hypogaea TaxID=3818 RepID=A0A445CSM8_ARAHY|nr:hypothetical protein Ahy_A06g029127 [Arachis hypogaea]